VDILMAVSPIAPSRASYAKESPNRSEQRSTEWVRTGNVRAK
jgi:hypothetical protein